MPSDKTWFHCSSCGHFFKSWKIDEYNTIFSLPMPCPKCSGRGYTIGLLGIIQQIRNRQKLPL